MDFDTLTLSRVQFAMTFVFHYFFPPLSIGLGALLVALGWLHRRTGDPDYRTLGRFWTQVFAVNLSVGVAAGIAMEFQFGSNWARFSRFAGDVFGSALTAEGIFAFFLESGFLAIFIFDWDRVSPRLHFFATVMVALGATFSAIWIVVANSWMNTPVGHQIVLHDGVPRAEVVDFWAMVLNPSAVHRVIHVLLGAFFVMAVIAAFTFLFGVALYPNLVVSSLGAEYNLTVWKASSSHGTLANLLIVAGIGMPFVLGYTVCTYWVFWKPGRPRPASKGGVNALA